MAEYRDKHVKMKNFPADLGFGSFGDRVRRPAALVNGTSIAALRSEGSIRNQSVR
jgi:hypothetical protein